MEKLFLALMMCLVVKSGTSQVQITGPDCVEIGSPNQYILNFKQSRTDSVKIQLQGGHFDNGDSIKYLRYPGAVLVYWDSIGINKIESVFSSNSVFLYINTISALISGEVLPEERIQYWDSSKANYVFHCEAPKGGACQPIYSFQWQSSTDGINFSNISGAIGRDLYFGLPILATTIFRRITKESQSNTLIMSEEARLVKQ